MTDSFKEKNRLAICVCYDPEGIIDRYVTYLLSQIKNNVNKLVIVVNGKLSSDSRRELKKISEDVFVRENTGFDFGAWKYAITDYIGWERMKQYDQLVLLNDSCFGPIYPFEDVFQKMDGSADFWGLVAHGELKSKNPFDLCPYGFLPAHLQSSFMVIERRLLLSKDFQDFWENLKTARNYQEAVAFNECVLTKHFEDLGYSWSTLIDTKDLDGDAPTAHSFFSPGQLLLRGMPMLKVKAFSQRLDDLLNVHMVDDLHIGMKYISEHTQYDTDLIYEHILRTCNIADIHDTLHLDYVISTEARKESKRPDGTFVVLLHLYYIDLLEEEKKYIQAIPEYMDVLVTTMSEKQKKAIEDAYSDILGGRLKVILMKNRGREAASLLVAAREHLLKYDYICFCQDKKSSQVPYATGMSFARLGWENMLCSKGYIENIVDTFSREPRLGLLVPPRFFGGAFLGNLPSNLWTICYNRTVDVAKMLGLTVNINDQKGIICTNSMFWARTKALLPLLDHDWQYEDFEEEPTPVDGALRHIIERILQFVAQDAGYYTGIVMTPEYAAIQTNAFFHLVQREMRRNQQLGLNQLTAPNRTFFTRIKYRLKEFLKRKLPYNKFMQLKKIYIRMGGKPL